MKYGVITETPAAPSRSAILVRRMTSRVVSAPVPTKTGERPFTCAMVSTTTICFSRSSSRVELAGGAEYEDAVHAAREHEVDVIPQTGEVEFVIRRQRRDDRE